MLIDSAVVDSSLGHTDYLNPLYWEDMQLGDWPLTGVSALLPTFNRAPYEQADQNPLGWAIRSLLEQRHGGIEEIVVVDDASSDFTQQTVEELRDSSSIPIIYRRNEKNLGSAITKNVAAGLASQDTLFYMDDDAVMPPFALFGLNTAYQQERSSGRVALVHPPIYFRVSVPEDVRPASDIGVLDEKVGAMSSNFQYFPAEAAESIRHMEKPEFLDEQLKLLAPMPVTNLMGIFLIDAGALHKAGGFPTHFTWRNSYTEESELALRLKELGYTASFVFDPKVHSVHFKYGFNNGTLFKGDDWLAGAPMSLTEMALRSNQPTEETGNRVNPDEWAYSKIIAKYVLFALRDERGANLWVQESYDAFVRCNSPFFYSYDQQSIPGFDVRNAIWERAVKEGKALVTRLQQQQAAQ